MSPEERALRETQVSSLDRQKRQLDLRHQAETEKLCMAAEEDLVNRFRSSLPTATPRAPAPARPTPRDWRPQEPFLKPWRPERLPLTRTSTSERPSTPQLEERTEKRVNFDPRGPYPPPTGKGGRAADRYRSKERRLAKKLPAGVPISAIYIDEEGRADMSWRNVPDSEKPPGALSGPGHGKGKGVGKQTHAAHAVQDAYGTGPIMDEVCRADLCNRRMWFALDNHPQQGVAT